MKVSEVGETGLLERITARLPVLPAGELGPGDDAAVLGGVDGSVLVTTDLLVEGLDLDLAYTSGADLGWKALAVNVSDICAMGGRARDAVVSVGLRPDLDVVFLDDFLDGLLQASEAFDTRLVGGDISGSNEIVVSVTILGAASHPVTRSGAQVGDAICVTGHLGGSAAGLRLLQAGAGAQDPVLAQRHLRPQPRIEEGAALAMSGATGMIDVSDGLGLDLSRLMRASDVGCRVDPALVPVEPAASDRYEDAYDLALRGGEDFELLVTLPSDRVDEARARLAPLAGLTRIGEVVEAGMMIGDMDLDEGGDLGWEHLRVR